MAKEEVGYQLVINNREFLKALEDSKRNFELFEDKFNKFQTNYQSRFNELSKTIESSRKNALNFWTIAGGGALGQVAVNTLSTIKNRVGQVGIEALSASKNYEQLFISFKTFLGSADEANKVLADLTKLAAKTPFGQDEIFGAARQLLALGVEVEVLQEKLTKLGDISAGTNKPLGELARIYGKILSQGKAQGDELIVVAEAGIPIYDKLAEITGKTVSQVFELQNQGKITFDLFERALFSLTGPGGRFNNLLEEQSESLKGIEETINDGVVIAFRNFFDGLMPTLKEVGKATIEWLDSLDLNKIKELGRSVGDLIKFLIQHSKTITLAIAGWVGYKTAVTAATVAQQILNTSIKLNPIGLLASVLAVLIPKLWEMTSATQKLTTLQKDLIKEFISEKSESDKLFKTLRDGTKTIKERTSALESLKSIFPEYVKHLDVERSTLLQIADAQKKVNESIRDSVFERKKAALETDAYSQAAEKYIRAQEVLSGQQFTTKEQFKHGIGGVPYAESNRQAIAAGIRAEGDAIIAAYKDKSAQMDLAKEDFLKSASLYEIKDLKLFGSRSGSQEQFIKRMDAMERAYTTTLKKMSKSQLELLKSSETERGRSFISLNDDRKVNVINEEIERRKKLSASIIDNTDNVNQLKEAYDDLLVRVDKSNISNLESIPKIKAEAKLAHEEVDKLEQQLTKLAKAAGKPLSIDAKSGLDLLRRDIDNEAERKIADELARINEEIIGDAGDALNKQEAIIKKRQQIEKNDLDARYSTASERLKLERDHLKELILLRKNEISNLDRAISTAQEGTDVDGQRVVDYGLVKQLQTFREKISEEYEFLLSEIGIVNRKIRVETIDNALQKIELSEKIALDEVELLKKSTDRTLSLEEAKEKQRLAIQIEYAKKRLELLEADPAYKNEAKQLRSKISVLEGQFAGFGGKNNAGFIGKFFKETFGFTDAQLNDLKSLYGQAATSILSSISEAQRAETEFQIEQNQKIIDSLRERLVKSQEILEQEKKLRAQGAAHNVESKQREINEIKAKEAAAVEQSKVLKQKQLKDQLAADLLAQTSNLITAVSGIISGWSSVPFVGSALGLVAAAGMFAAFAGMKIKAYNLAKQSLFTGGPLEQFLNGESDRTGKPRYTVVDNKTGKPKVNLGGNEIIMNAQASSTYRPELDQMNRMKFVRSKSKALINNTQHERSHSKVLIKERYELETQKEIQAKVQYKENFKESFNEALQAYHEQEKQYWDERGDVVPTPDGYMRIAKHKQQKFILKW